MHSQFAVESVVLKNCCQQVISGETGLESIQYLYTYYLDAATFHTHPCRTLYVFIKSTFRAVLRVSLQVPHLGGDDLVARRVEQVRLARLASADVHELLDRRDGQVGVNRAERFKVTSAGPR